MRGIVGFIRVMRRLEILQYTTREKDGEITGRRFKRHSTMGKDKGR